jgi:2-polyprenyl-6-methoxyphenol hydroxylase-like FAD-dependent oxidoreductase
MAIESAVVLAHELSKGGDPERGLRAYERARRARTAWVTARSWSLGRMFTIESRLIGWLRDRVNRSRIGRWAGRRTFERLLVHDLPELP